MLRGRPSLPRTGPRAESDDPRIARCSIGNELPRGGKWGGKWFPPGRAEKSRKCSGLARWPWSAFGEEAKLVLNLVFGTLVIMRIVLMGTLEQSGYGPSQEVR